MSNPVTEELTLKLFQQLVASINVFASSAPSTSSPDWIVKAAMATLIHCISQLNAAEKEDEINALISSATNQLSSSLRHAMCEKMTDSVSSELH